MSLEGARKYGSYLHGSGRPRSQSKETTKSHSSADEGLTPALKDPSPLSQKVHSLIYSPAAQ